LPSINVTFLAFGERPPAASLWPLRVDVKGTSDELDEPYGAKWTNRASANVAGLGARTLAASIAAVAPAHAKARDLVGPPARRRRTESSELRAADLAALHPPAIAKKEKSMPRYLVERTFPQGLGLPQNAEGALMCTKVSGENAQRTKLPVDKITEVRVLDGFHMWNGR
jgi:hypothetical protein